MILHSRVHRIPSFDTSTATCWVKRDDELGFGISGSKLRKYHSLLPFLLKEAFDLVIVIGGINSNNVLGLSQLLVENRVPFKLYLKGDPTRPLIGNGWLTALIAGQEHIRWVSRQDWPRVEEIASEENRACRHFIVPEGACCFQSLAGAQTLATDIFRNEQEIGRRFSHIFIDAGTGLTAIALLQRLQGNTHVHIVLVAGDETSFRSRLQLLGGDVAANYTLYRPSTAASFGATNRAVWDEVQRVAREEGILIDPIYTAKLMGEARRIIRNSELTGDILIIHGGGGLSLVGCSLAAGIAHTVSAR